MASSGAYLDLRSLRDLLRPPAPPTLCRPRGAEVVEGGETTARGEDAQVAGPSLREHVARCEPAARAFLDRLRGMPSAELHRALPVALAASELVSLGVSFRAWYGTLLECTAAASALPRQEEDAASRLLDASFDTVFTLIAHYFEDDAPSASLGEKATWVAVQVVDLMSQLDFCRTAHHAGYIAVLSAVLPIVKDSNAGSRMLLHQMLRDAPPLAHLPSRNLAVQSRRYFVLRLLPALVPRLDTCLAEPALWNFLGACIREAPGSTQAPIARLGHEAVAMALEHIPVGATPTCFPGYLAVSLDLFPHVTPFDAFARAVLALMKRAGVDEEAVHLCADALLRSAEGLEEFGIPGPASSLRKLCIGLLNVVPLCVVEGLLQRFESLYAHAQDTLRRRLREEMLVVLDANWDYNRKPHIARWYQHLTQERPSQPLARGP